MLSLQEENCRGSELVTRSNFSIAFWFGHLGVPKEVQGHWDDGPYIVPHLGLPCVLHRARLEGLAHSVEVVCQVIHLLSAGLPQLEELLVQLIGDTTWVRLGSQLGLLSIVALVAIRFRRSATLK